MSKLAVKFLLVHLFIINISCNAQNETIMESGFRYSICEPLNPDIIEKGKLDEEMIIKTFKEFPWKKYLTDMIKANDKDIQYSPSIEFENKSNKNGITISAVGNPDDFEFYIFYKRPKKKKHLFGLLESKVQNHLSEITGQTEDDVIDCLNALIQGELNFLENKFK